ncbi:hypothetical protein LTR94_035310, partial [Friedmanniomyces endolithicus]
HRGARERRTRLCRDVDPAEPVARRRRLGQVCQSRTGVPGAGAGARTLRRGVCAARRAGAGVRTGRDRPPSGTPPAHAAPHDHEWSRIHSL